MRINESGAAGVARMPDTGVSQVKQAIRAAAVRTGVSFDYLMKKASIESGGDPNAEARTSSATGLFQFTAQTWLRTLKSRGAEYGLGRYADQISIASDGTAYVSDPGARQAILDLRKDPQISAEMACELDKANSAALQQRTTGPVGPTELYLAHLLGASGAGAFLNTLHANPNAQAADILPKAAGSNPSIFYSVDGTPRTVAQIYSNFAERFEQPGAASVAGIQSDYGAAEMTASLSLRAGVSPNSGRALYADMAAEYMKLTAMATVLAEDEAEESTALSVLI